MTFLHRIKKILPINYKKAQCYSNAWLFLFKMSHYVSLSVKYSGRGLNFSLQSIFEISLSTAKLWSGESGTYFATYPHEVWCVTEVCCPGIPISFAYYMTRHLVRISLDSIQRKNQYIGPLPHPLPSLAGGMGWLKWLQAVTPNYSNCISYNFLIFCQICLKFSH